MDSKPFHFIDDYRQLVQELMAAHPLDEAMSMAVGGAFEVMGTLEKQILIQAGFKENHHLVDVGCGSGRLAVALRDYFGPKGHYLGTDVVAELLQYAREKCPPTWRFEAVEGLVIPANDASADFVSFFSVFTHLLQHESYLYLMEAKRVLRPGGKIVFSWLQFPQNWDVFEATVMQQKLGKRLVHLNEFTSVDAIAAWAAHLDFGIEQMRRPDEAFIEMNGGLHAMGQAVTVFVKR